MKNNIRKLFLLMAVVATLVMCYAFSAGALSETGKCGDNVYWNFDSTTGKLEIYGEGPIWNYETKHEVYRVGGYTYDRIVPTNPFDTPDVKSIVIKEGITAIGNCAFYSYYGGDAESITIPDTVTYIGHSAFYACGFKSVTIPDSVKNIGELAFRYCQNLKKLTLGTGLKTIGRQAFAFCKRLKSVTIPANVTTIGEKAFGYYKDAKVGSFTVYGPHDSVAEDYARDNSFPFKPLHENDAYVIREATCNSEGMTLCICSDCGASTMETSEKLTHQIVTVKAKAATCTKTGLTEGKKCSLCGEVTQEQKTVAKKGHSYKTTSTTKATFTKNGKVVKKCTVCGDKKSTTVYCPTVIKLSATSFTYNGKVKTPSVTVKDADGNTLKKGTDYTVKYASGRKNPGKYTVTVTFKGKYTGSKKLSFTIKPQAPAISSVTSSTKGKAVVKWNNVAGESGYQVYYSTNKNGTYKKVDSYAANKTAGSKSKLTSKKTYYFKVRAYKKTSGDVIYSSWSSVKSVKVK